MTPAFDPIAPWMLVITALAVVLVLTLWAYHRRLRETSGAWRWLALGLRLAAIALCLFAALRPSLLLKVKVKQPLSLVFLLDGSTSMGIADEANNQRRIDSARKSLAEGQAALKGLKTKLDVRALAFDEKVKEFSPGDDGPPTGPATAIGNALDEALKRTAGNRLVGVVLLTDGASNAGLPPLAAASSLKTQQVPVIGVGFGSENAGASSRDLVARDLVVGPQVFVKNEPTIRAVVGARGFQGQPVEVELYVEDEKVPSARTRINVKDANAVIPVTDLKWVPQHPGETKLTLKVRPKDGELVPTNNELSTYVTVQAGGLAVLYLQGPNFAWEYKFLTRALDAAQEIQATLRVIRRPASEDPSALPDEELTPGRYDVIILGDVPANFLTPVQRAALRRCVERGAGLMMLGGRSSFGPGGWAGTEVAEILPTRIHPGDGQLEPPEGLKVMPTPSSLENYVVRLGPTPAESQRIWSMLPPLEGANQLGPPKQAAIVLAQAASGEPLMVAQEVPRGRVLAFAGETWPWARLNEETQAAHRKFWRQAILWLAHKEDQGSDQVKLALDRRRVAVGQKLELTGTARDAKGEPMTDVKYETTVQRLVPDAKPEPVELFNVGSEARGTHFVTGEAGEYRVTLKGYRDGQLIGTDTARFLAFQDDRELENPAADFALLRQLAEMTDGVALPPERLAEYLRSFKLEDLTDSVVQREVLLWDNWYFLLAFVGLLTLEWWLRKRHGWV